eukprot:158358-Pleurochrysis_carterae.AAC.2
MAIGLYAFSQPLISLPQRSVSESPRPCDAKSAKGRCSAKSVPCLSAVCQVDMHVCVGDIDDCSDTSWTDESSYSYELCEGDTCTGIWSVFRISFTCAVFFALLLLSNLYPSQCAAYTHRGYWCELACCVRAQLSGSNDVFPFMRD